MKIKFIIIAALLIQNYFSMFAMIKEAYWYSFLPINVTLAQNEVEPHSYLEIVGDTCLRGKLKIEAIFNNSEETYKDTVEIREDTKRNSISDGICSYFFKMPYFAIPPSLIIIKDRNGYLLNKIECEYFKIEGHVACELPHKNLYIGVVPNDFNDPDLLHKVQTDGHYSLLLPQRHYNALFAVADSYGEYTLENWTFNIGGNENLKLNYNIQNAEIYNLHAWENNGGGNSLFIVFRPMILDKQTINKIKIGGENFNEISFDFNLNKNNFNVSTDNDILKIISVQSFLETDVKGNAIKSYILQVEYDKRFRHKLLTVTVNCDDYHGSSNIFLKQ
jgi:hypothetical protein